jgi:hypothetical protein
MLAAQHREFVAYTRISISVAAADRTQSRTNSGLRRGAR